MKIVIQKGILEWRLYAESELGSPPCKVKSSIEVEAKTKTELLAEALQQARKLEKVAKEMQKEIESF